MIYYYESELYPAYYREWQDYDWGKAELLSLPTDELWKKYKEYSEVLEKLRIQEPAKKRRKKEDYRSWIQRTHDLRDLLNDIAEELRTRKKSKVYKPKSVISHNNVDVQIGET